MDQEISEAIQRDPDYSQSFSDRMNTLRLALARALNVPIYHDADMNYSASQELSIFLDEQFGPCEKGDKARCEIAIFVSSRGPFFTVACLRRVRDNEWEVLPEPPKSKQLQTILHRVCSLLENNGLKGVFGSVLKEPAAGRTTAMDGVPATVFQALFSELY